MLLNTRYLIRLVLTKSLNHYLAITKSEQTEKEESEQTEEGESEHSEEKPNKPSWVNVSDENYSSLIQNVVNNLGDKNYQTTVNNQKYDLNKAKDFFVKNKL